MSTYPCDKCGGPTRVRDSRESKDLAKIPEWVPKGTTRRRRVCMNCGHRETTYELPLKLLENIEAEARKGAVHSVLNGIGKTEILSWLNECMR